MIKAITKRDGRQVSFDIDKITNAIYKAAQQLGGNDRATAEELSAKVVFYIENELKLQTPTVEAIQDAVEKILVENGHARTAKEFIIYRAERSRVRQMNTKLMKTYEDLTFQDAVENDIKRENANIDGNTAMGTMLKYGSEGAKQFYEMFILDPKHAKAHSAGDIHIHDMDFYTLTTTCCQIDLIKLFENGFSTGHGYLREPNDIQSYAALACIAIQSNQNDQHGGQSIPNFEYALAKGVEKSYSKLYRVNLTKALDMLCQTEHAADVAQTLIDQMIRQSGDKARIEDSESFLLAQHDVLFAHIGDEQLTAHVIDTVKRYTMNEIERSTFQAMEALVHNLNTMHSRAGAQIPFSSINYGTDTTPEGRMVIKNVLLATDKGLGNGETPIFPIHIFKVKEGVNYNPQDPNYDLFKLACKVSAKRLFPNFSFLDAPFNAMYYKEGNPDTEIAYMGCRTRVMANAADPEREVVNGRGNLSFTSINLPRIGIKSHGDIDWFFEELERKLDLVCDQLLHRYKIQCQKYVRNYPFLMGQGIWIDSEHLGPDDTLEQVLKHGTLTVGFIGLAECLKALIGSHHGQTKEAQTLGLEIVGYMRTIMDRKCKETGLNFSLIATPAEGLSGRFVRIDRRLYGELVGITDRDYYTNSFHVPVYFEINAFDKINLEAPYHALTNGGHISYVELDGDPLGNLDAFEQIVRAMKEAGIGYGSINHPVDRDPVCGYTGIIGDTCPCCGREEYTDNTGFERIRRITGYLVGTLDRFNNAKRAEVTDRVKHTVGKIEQL